MVGITETKEGAGLALSLVKAFRNAQADGKIDWKDSIYLGDPLRKLSAGLKDIGQVRAELLDMDEDEQNELVDYVISELGPMSSAKALQIARRAINWILDGVQLSTEIGI